MYCWVSIEDGGSGHCSGVIVGTQLCTSPRLNTVELRTFSLCHVKFVNVMCALGQPKWPASPISVHNE